MCVSLPDTGYWSTREDLLAQRGQPRSGEFVTHSHPRDDGVSEACGPPSTEQRDNNSGAALCSRITALGSSPWCAAAEHLGLFLTFYKDTSKETITTWKEGALCRILKFGAQLVVVQNGIHLQKVIGHWLLLLHGIVLHFWEHLPSMRWTDKYFHSLRSVMLLELNVGRYIQRLHSAW